MGKRFRTTTLKGGWVKRDASTGKFVEVGTKGGVAKASPTTETTVRDASSKRSSALKRLADR
jgi:hypothetical protein